MNMFFYLHSPALLPSLDYGIYTVTVLRSLDGFAINLHHYHEIVNSPNFIVQHCTTGTKGE